ncbi:MAG: DUF4294 domain-containing protein [Bacteroidota bacterium]
MTRLSISISITIILLVYSHISDAQELDSSRMGIGIIQGQDTIIQREIKEVWVYPARQFKSPRYERQYWRLVQRVKKVLPYAKTANHLLKQYEPEYLKLTTDRERRRLIKKVEDELMARYKDDLKKMSISDGRVLIKLIDRETGRTSYTLIKEFRGGVSAAFWQGIARIFKNNLKDEFDPYGEDLLIEEIVTLIEIGYL